MDKALEHFDDFYKQVYTQHWEHIRAGLLGTQKYVAVVNNYGDSEEAMKKLESNGAINVRKLFEVEKGYLAEHSKKRRRQKKLQQVWDSEAITTEEQPPKIPVEASELSLEYSLKQAQYDRDRIVDENNALSADILREFVPATKIKGGSEDFIPESEHYRMYDTSKTTQIPVERENDIHFPEHLNIYCYEQENFSDFPPAKRGSTGVLNYYLMDGGSILPVLALDLRPGCKLLDLCAAPGGKSLLAVQTLYPDLVHSNDVSYSRVERIKRVYEQFLYDFHQDWVNEGKIKLSQHDGRVLVEDVYDRILVDVPCTTDRHSLHQNDNNIFKTSRIKERLKLPEMQCELLVSALKMVQKDGIVVYSTCSLSPIQNDGVVYMALKRVCEETNLRFAVKWVWE